MKTLFARLVIIAAVGVLGGTGIASLAPDKLEGHRSSLQAIATLTDGTVRRIKLQGVGCSVSMCSRVAMENVQFERMWLDGLTSMREIADSGAGPVGVTVRFKNGADRRESIASGNRVLYIDGSFGATEKLDIGKVSRIDFSR